MVGEVSRVAVHREMTTSLGADPLPPPNDAVTFSSLESFHPHGSDRLAKEAKLTRREGSHFIVAMAARSCVMPGFQKKTKHSSYVCPRSSHIQQQNRNIRNNVI